MIMHRCTTNEFLDYNYLVNLLLFNSENKKYVEIRSGNFISTCLTVSKIEIGGCQI